MKRLILSTLKGDLARSSILIFFSSLSANSILFLANLFIANQLGASQFGVFKTIIYLFTFLPLLIELGVNMSLTKYISEFRSKKKIRYLVKWFLKLKTFSYLVLIVLVFLLKDQIGLIFFKDASLSYLILPGILLMGLNFFKTFQFIILGYQKFKFFAISNFLTITISAVIGILLSSFGIFYLVLFWGFGMLIGNLFNIKFFFKEKILGKSKEFNVKKLFLRFSIPVYFVGIATGLFTAIVPFLSLFFSQELVGYFSFAFIFYNATLLVPLSISNVLFPKVSELNGLKRHEDAKNILKKAFALHSIVFLFGILFVILFSDWFFITFFENYLPSLFMFKILLILGLVFGYNNIYTNYLKGLGKMKKFVLLILVQNILIFLISFVLLSST